MSFNSESVSKDNEKQILDSGNPSSTDSTMSSLTTWSDCDSSHELIIERVVPIDKHDDPPEVYERLKEMVKQIQQERNNLTLKRGHSQSTELDLLDLQPRNAECNELRNNSIVSYEEFKISLKKRIRTSSPSPESPKLTTNVQNYPNEDNCLINKKAIDHDMNFPSTLPEVPVKRRRMELQNNSLEDVCANTNESQESNNIVDIQELTDELNRSMRLCHTCGYIKTEEAATDIRLKESWQCIKKMFFENVTNYEYKKK